jgi:hypothetical protein
MWTYRKYIITPVIAHNNGHQTNIDAWRILKIVK